LRNLRFILAVVVMVIASTLLAAPANATIGPRVVGGKPVKVGEIPELAALLFRIPGEPAQNRLFCSGTLLDSTHVLTAGHCGDAITFVDGQFVLGVQAQVGSRDLGDPKAQTVGVKSVTVNKSFWNGNISQDVSIFTLRKPVLWNAARLARGSDRKLTKAGSKVTIAGWGLREKIGVFEFPTGETPIRAHAVNTSVVDDRVCKKMYDDNILKGFVVPPTDICAGELGKDACYGDSGGPLLATDGEGNRIEVGVVSRGAGCATEFPGVFTDVAAMRDWIDKNLATPCNVLAMPGFSDNLFVC
jgi:secreted trypsin-like serine protease